MTESDSSEKKRRIKEKHQPNHQVNKHMFLKLSFILILCFCIEVMYLFTLTMALWLKPGTQLSVLPGIFTAKNIYNMTLTVQGRNWKVEASKIIVVKESQEPKLSPLEGKPKQPRSLLQEIVIECPRLNCKGLIPPDDEIELTIYNQKDNPIEEKYKWQIIDEDGREIPLSQVMIAQRYNYQLLIDPNQLKEDKEYEFSVLVSEKVRAIRYIKIKMDRPPAFGNCTLTPEQGVRGVTKFDVECVDWRDLRGVVLFEFFDKGTNNTDHYDGRMLGSSYSGKLYQFMLTRGTFVVYIINMNGLSNNYSQQVELSNSFLPPKYLYTMMDTVINYKYSAEMLRLATVLSEIISPDQVNVKGNLFETIIHKFSAEMQLHTLEELKLSILSMKIFLIELTSKGVYKFKDVTLNEVAHLLKNMGQMFKNILSNDYHTPKLRSKSVSCLAKNVMDSIEIVLLASSQDITLSPEQDVDEDQIINLDLASSDLSKATELILYCVSRLQKASHNHTEISSNEQDTSMWTLVDKREGLINSTAMQFNETSVEITKEMASPFGNQTDFMLQYTVMKKNMFWWTGKQIYTDVVLVEFAQLVKKQKFVFLKRLNKPLNIFLKINHIEKITRQGNVIQLDASLDSHQLNTLLLVYRIIPPALSKLYIKFDFSIARYTLRVLVLQNQRVTWNHIKNLYQIISKTNYEYDVPYDAVDRENFYYMGILPDKGVPVNTSTEYVFHLYYMMCRTWVSQWTNQYCWVGNRTSESVLECCCSHLSVFAGTTGVPLNDVSKIQDSNLIIYISKNSIIIIFLLLLILFFILSFLWADFMDSKDCRHREVVVLDDNYPGDSHGYLIAVFTGSRPTAGTTANVGIRLIGDDYGSRPHILKSSKRQVLLRSSDDWFLLFYPVSLGRITEIHLWHDNTGHSPDWFCSKIIIYDLKTENEYIFFIEQWLALEIDAYPEAIVLPATFDEILNIKRIFLDNSSHGMRESHTWLSVFTRHPRSAISRKARLTVLIVCIMSAMCASIMLFDGSNETVAGMDEFSFSISQREIIISIKTFIISSICTIIVLFLFSKSYREKSYIHQSLTCAPTKRLSSTPSDHWFHNEKKNFYDPGKMVKYKSQDIGINTKNSCTGCVVRVLTGLVTAKTFQPVYLEKKIKDFDLIKKWFISAWLVSIVITVYCTYMISICSMKYGTVRTQKWLASLCLAFSQDIFLLSPLKIIFLSMLMSFVFERMFNAGTFDLDVKYALKRKLIGNKAYLENLVQTREHPMYHPIAEELKLKLREKCLRLTRWRTLLDFVLVFIFIIVLCYLISSLWSGIHFVPNTHALTLLTAPRKHTDTVFNDIFNRTHFINYLESTFVSALYTYRWFDSVHQPLLNTEDGCSVNPVFEPYNMKCMAPWSASTMDKAPHGVNWEEATQEDSRRAFTFWRYTDEWNSSVFSLPGKTGTIYPSGGYSFELSSSRLECRKLLRNMKDLNWQDEYTRVTFAELTLYNVNTDLFSQVTMVAEHLSYGLFLTISYEMKHYCKKKKKETSNVIAVKIIIEITSVFIYFFLTSFTIESARGTRLALWFCFLTSFIIEFARGTRLALWFCFLLFIVTFFYHGQFTIRPEPRFSRLINVLFRVELPTDPLALHKVSGGLSLGRLARLTLPVVFHVEQLVAGL